MTPQEIWLATLSQLQLQIPRSTYDTWLRDTKFVAYDEATKTFTIRVRNQYAKDWLEQKLHRPIQQGLSKTARDEAVRICFTTSRPDTPIVETPTEAPAESELDRLRRELAEAHQHISTLQQENAHLKQEAAYQREWGGSLTTDQDSVTIARTTLKQVALTCLDKAPRTAAPLFLYILSQVDATGVAALEATAVSRDLLKLENRRSWANLLGPIFGTLVQREGHHLRLNVTMAGYSALKSNHPPLQGMQPAATERNRPPLQGEKLSPPAVTIPENVTTGGHISAVILNDDDLNQNSSPLEGCHQSTPLPLESKLRLDQRQRQLFAMQFNRDVATKYQWAITYAPDETWESWLEQAGRGKTPAALMCDKIKAYQERVGAKVIDLRGRTG